MNDMPTTLEALFPSSSDATADAAGKVNGSHPRPGAKEAPRAKESLRVATPPLTGPAKPAPEPDFGWDADCNPDVVQVEVPTVAIYRNPHGNAVIRKRQEWDEDDDTIIILAHAGLPDVIERLRLIYDAE